MDYKTIEASIDALAAELEQISVKLSSPNVDLRAVRMGLDRIEAIRANIYSLKHKVLRKWLDAKWVYDDGFRSSANSGSRNQRVVKAYEERRAEYETVNLAYLQELRKWERVKDETVGFLRHIESKIKWLDGKRFELLDEEKREQYISSREIMSKD